MTLLSVSTIFANCIFLFLVAGVPLIGLLRGVKVYEVFVEGAKEGFTVSITIIPYLVAMLVAIGMFRASGALDVLATVLAPVLDKIGLPSELLPFALIRPFSGSAAIGMMAEVIHHHGGNAYISQLAATMMGSTETTFYIVAVYFGSVSISRTRHAIPVGLLADATGVMAALFVCSLLLK